MKGKERKKFVGLLVVGLLALGLLAGCGEAAEPTTDEPVEQAQQTTEQQPTTPTADTITAEPMTDERHLAAQQAVTAPAAEMEEILATDFITAISDYITALEGNVPQTGEGLILTESDELTSYILPITDNCSFFLPVAKADGTMLLTTFSLQIDFPLTEEDWGMVEDYFYAISYYLDRDRPGNLWQALAVTEATAGDINRASYHDYTYIYIAREDAASFSIMPNTNSTLAADEIGVSKVAQQ